MDEKVDYRLLNLLETILGKGDSKSKGNYAFYCPKCKHHKKKLEINLISTTEGKNPYACWVCSNFKGTTLNSLFKALNVDSSKYEELSSIIGSSYKYSPQELKQEYKIELPKEFTPFINMNKSDIIGRHALNYLLKVRGISFADIIKLNCGFCEFGKYKNKIIIPSYSKEGILEYFVARSFIETEYKIDAPKSDKNIIGFESLINFNLPIILCEGPFDSISIKRNAIPLFGKTISKKLEERLTRNQIKEIYLALDGDALKNTFNIAEKLLNLGKKVHIIRLKGKDPSEVGFLEFTKIMNNSNPINFSDLIKLKMEIN